MKLFDLSLKLNGFPIDRARLELQDVLSVPEKDYETFNAQRREDLVRFHLDNNSFYRQLARNTIATDWKTVPVMYKTDLQRPLEQRLSKGFTAKTVFVNKTSGSSGNPMTFAKDKYCHALIWANITRRFAWHSIDFNSALQGRFYGRTLDGFAGLKLRVKDWLSHRYRFDIFDLSDAALEKVLLGFRKKKFAYLNGYTSNIVQLAKFLRTRKLVLKTVCPTLKVCVVTSEMLFEEDRQLIQTWLGVPVVNEYGASELDLIAMEDASGSWRINAETIFVEILDDQDNPVPNGTQGRIVVTSLYNKAHPFIRYDVGDFGILDEKSTSKHPILKKLVGRTNDFATLPSGKKPAGMTFYSITKKLFEDDGNVGEFIIRQTKLDTFEIEYTSQLPLEKSETERMTKILTDYLEPGLTFQFIRKTALKRTSAGKLKQFESLLP